MLAQICAENELVKARLSRQMPDIGDASLTCEQAGRSFGVTVSVQPTPNPNFRRVDAQVLDATTRRCCGCRPSWGDTDEDRERSAASRWSNCWWRCSPWRLLAIMSWRGLDGMARAQAQTAGARRRSAHAASGPGAMGRRPGRDDRSCRRPRALDWNGRVLRLTRRGTASVTDGVLVVGLDSPRGRRQRHLAALAVAAGDDARRARRGLAAGRHLVGRRRRRREARAKWRSRRSRTGRSSTFAKTPGPTPSPATRPARQPPPAPPARRHPGAADRAARRRAAGAEPAAGAGHQRHAHAGLGAAHVPEARES